MNKPLLHDEIPIAIVWDNNLTDKDKLVGGEIFTMLNQGKPFIMSNEHLAERLNCTSRTISKTISHLVKNGWIKTRAMKSRNGNTEFREVYGFNVLRALKFSSRAHRNICLGVHEENFHQIDHSNRSINKSVTNNGKPNIRQMIVKDLESLMVNINTFVAQDIDDWIKRYDPKLILKAIHQVGSTSPSPTWVVKDISTQLSRGCQVHQPKRRMNYGNKPAKSYVPDWAKKGYHQKLHPTSKKVQAKIKKQLKNLDKRDGKK